MVKSYNLDRKSDFLSDRRYRIIDSDWVSIQLNTIPFQLLIRSEHVWNNYMDQFANKSSNPFSLDKLLTNHMSFKYTYHFKDVGYCLIISL